MAPGSSLRHYRKERKVTQQELAEELGRPDKSYICRLERRDLTPAQYATAIAAVEKIVERRQKQATPVEVALAEVSQ